ncbi:GDYXXLXY domain-containing protein [Paenibacillus filicis]|uniref:GDYXXLXY domain-containing protein n=1 Tax=Paenibacillus filicis TaxID=669464 RepID=A0ABU9DUM4_9BACL
MNKRAIPNMEVELAPRRRGVLAAMLVGLQVLVLIGIAISFYAVSWFGKDVQVRTVPVDPRDLLYGDYVNLSYEFSRLPASSWKGAGSGVKQGQVLYVVVRPESDGAFVATSAYDRKPDLSGGEVILKGRAAYSWKPQNNGDLRINYGIEKYYVPENTGKELEEQASRLLVHLKVAPWGQAKIEGLKER